MIIDPNPPVTDDFDNSPHAKWCVCGACENAREAEEVDSRGHGRRDPKAEPKPNPDKCKVCGASAYLHYSGDKRGHLFK